MMIVAACVPAPGAPTEASPAGHLDIVEAFPGGGAVVSGWADDRDSNDPISVAVFAGGEWVAVDVARWSRPDVGDAHGTGDLHGFRVAIDAVAVGDVVCVSAINIGPGANSLLGCRPVVAQQLLDASPDCSAPLAPNVNLAGCDLTDRSFNGANLEQADLRGANLSGRSLDSANLWRADLTGANLTDAGASFTSFEGAKLWNVTANGASFLEVSFLRARMTGFSTQASTFHLTSFKSANLEQVNVGQSVFIDGDFSSATLSSDRLGWERARFLGVTVCRSGLLQRDGNVWQGCLGR